MLYSSLHTGLFEEYDMVLYEPVMQVKDFHYRTLVLIGESRSNVKVVMASNTTKISIDWALCFGGS